MYAEQMLLENEGKKVYKIIPFFFISAASEMTFFKFVLLYKLPGFRFD